MSHRDEHHSPRRHHRQEFSHNLSTHAHRQPPPPPLPRHTNADQYSLPVTMSQGANFGKYIHED